MDYSLYLTTCISIGVLVGFIVSIFLVTKKNSLYHNEKYLSFHKKFNNVVGYITAFILIEGLIWCGHFLILAITDPTQAEYATNMSQLIVSVLTVVSIIFAFLEFIRRKNKQ